MVILLEAHLLIFSVSGNNVFSIKLQNSKQFYLSSAIYSNFFPKGFFSGRCRTVHIVFRRIPINDIPLDSEGQRKWIFDAFKRKDRSVFLTASVCYTIKGFTIILYMQQRVTVVYMYNCHVLCPLW